MKEMIKHIVKENKTPLFIYDYEIIKKNIYKLNKIVPPNGKIYYSMKANPNLAICQIINNLIGRVEVSSLGEMRCAIKAGYKIKNILFSGPGKAREELIFALNKGIEINVESVQELQEISDICKKGDMAAAIMIRINPDFTSKSSGFVMTGKASQFGIEICDIDKLSKIIRENNLLKIMGLSVYLGSQIMEADIIVENTREIIKLFLSVQKKLNMQLRQLDVGGGFGVSYYDKRELDINILQKQMKQMFWEFQTLIKNVEIFYESGRYILADSGYFITKVLYQKESKGRDYLICDGGFNDILITSFFTRELRGNFPIEVLGGDNNSKNFKEYYISGPLCSPKDILGNKIKLPSVTPGDYLIIHKVGAYGLTYSPVLFISHDLPAEILIKGKQYFIIRARQQNALTGQIELPQNIISNRSHFITEGI